MHRGAFTEIDKGNCTTDAQGDNKWCDDLELAVSPA